MIALIEERKDVRHIAVLSQPIGWFHQLTTVIEHLTGRLPYTRLGVKNLLSLKHVSIGIVRLLFVVDEESDAGSEEVHSRGLEELVAATSTFLLTFL